MATALQNPEWFSTYPDRCPASNRQWVNSIISDWTREVAKADLERRRECSAPLVEQKPISDADVSELLARLLNPNPITNPWAETASKQGQLFQAQLFLILTHLSYDAKSRGVGPDGGIDIEAQSPEGRAILIQVKKYSSPVRKELVEEFHRRSLSSAFGLTLPELWFVAPVLTEGARAFCATNMMKAIEQKQLADLLSQALKNGLDPDRLLLIDPGRLGQRFL